MVRSSIPGGGHEGRLDVAIERDRIAAVDRGIPPESAFRVVDAAGQIVTPGLVDLHAHVFHKLTYWGIDPDPVGLAHRRHDVERRRLGRRADTPGLPRVHRRPGAGAESPAFVNISSIGLVCDDYECANPRYLDVGLFRRMVDRNRDLVRGVKVRMGNLAPLEGDAARAAAARAAARPTSASCR